MSPLVPATMDTAFAKIGLYGNAGSGKTRTAIEIALGLAHMTGRPIAFFDTEGGSDYFVKRCKREGVELLVDKARTFARLMEYMEESEALGAIQVIDSITHVWDDLRQSYEAKLGRTQGLEIWDWSIIKPEWGRFNTAYLVSQCHTLVCGRQSDVYERVWNKSKRRWEVEVTDTKMRTEKETAYEPSLLIHMVRQPKEDEPGWWHVAQVEKDRADQMDGAIIQNPTWSDFSPFFGELNIGGEHKPTDASGDSQHLFEGPDEEKFTRARRRKIAVEKIEDAFLLAGLSSRRANDAVAIKAGLQRVFGTSSKTEFERFDPDVLEAGLASLREAMDGMDQNTDPEVVRDALASAKTHQEMAEALKRAADIEHVLKKSAEYDGGANMANLEDMADQVREYLADLEGHENFERWMTEVDSLTEFRGMADLLDEVRESWSMRS